MAHFKLLNFAGPNGEPRPAVLAGGEAVFDLQEALRQSGPRPHLAVLGAWEERCR